MVPDGLRVIGAIVWKDLILESRHKRSTSAAAVFSLLIVVVLSFVFVQEVQTVDSISRGALWIAIVFAGTLGMTRAIGVEEQNRALDGLLLAPVDRSAIYLGKVCSVSIFVTIVGYLSMAFVAVFLDYTMSSSVLLTLVYVIPLAAIGFSAVGVLLTTLTIQSPIGESLLPVLLIPLVVPVLLSGIELSRGLARTETMWLQVLLIYDGLVLLAGWTLFEFVIEG